LPELQWAVGVCQIIALSGLGKGDCRCLGKGGCEMILTDFDRPMHLVCRDLRRGDRSLLV
jgi:hypothetical protein